MSKLKHSILLLLAPLMLLGTWSCRVSPFPPMTALQGLKPASVSEAATTYRINAGMSEVIDKLEPELAQHGWYLFAEDYVDEGGLRGQMVFEKGDPADQELSSGNGRIVLKGLSASVTEVVLEYGQD